MGVFSCVAGCIIILINIVFLILGLVFAALGVVLKFGAPWISTYVQPILKPIIDIVKEQFPDANIDVDTILKTVLGLGSSIAIFLLVIGIFFLIMAFTGMCGVCCSSKILLTIFCVITGAIFVTVLTISLWTYTSKDALEKIIKSPLEDFLKKYKGVGNYDGNTLLIDFLGMGLKCCGINNGSDFDTINWNNKLNYTYNGKEVEVDLVYPLSCCKFDSSRKPIDGNCTYDPTPLNSNYKFGCWEKLTGGFLGYFHYLNFGLFGICGFFLILLLLGLVIICCDKKNKVRDSV